MAYTYTGITIASLLNLEDNETAFRCEVTGGGTFNILKGARATSTTVAAETGTASLKVSSGGVVTSSFVNAGGKMMVYGYGKADYSTINNGGIGYAYNKGSAAQTTIEDGGTFYVKDGATLSNTTVNAGGKLHVSSSTNNGAGVLNGNNVIAGNVYVSGGLLTGTFDLVSAAGYVYVKAASELNLDVANDADGSTALFQRFNQVKTPDNLTVSITVNDGKQEGDYKLVTSAQNLVGKTISVKNVAGAEIGSVTVSATAAVGFSTSKALYTFSKVNASTGYTFSLNITAKGSASVTVTNGEQLATQIEADPLALTVNLTEYPDIADAVAFNGIVTTVKAGNFGSRLFCGKDANTDANGIKTTGSYSLAINGGSFTSLVFGGDRLSGDKGTVDHTGGITTEITAGSFNTVGGGMMHDLNVTTAGIIRQIGDVSLTIKGGTFTGYVFGGNIAAAKAAASSTRSYVNGNVSLTLDSTSGDLSFAKAVYAGSYGKGTINGSVELTLTGANDVTVQKDLWGGCSSDSYSTGKVGRRTFNTKITGDRTLTFDGFTGTLTAGNIGGFKHLVCKKSSNVTLASATTDKTVALGDISYWEISYGSTISGAFGNNFYNDTLVLGSASSSLGADPWTVMDNSFADAYEALGNCTSVTLFGEEASRNAAGWASDSYQLSIVDGTKLQVSALSIA